jgi:hypothetical protein
VSPESQPRYSKDSMLAHIQIGCCLLLDEPEPPQYEMDLHLEKCGCGVVMVANGVDAFPCCECEK